MEVKKKRGRPPKQKVIQQETSVINEKLDEDVVERKGPYKFITSKCKCVFYKHFVLGPMFCKHKHPMHLDTDTREQ